MGEILKNRLKMSRFESPFQEALLGLMTTASELRTRMDRTLTKAGITGEQYNILRILRGVYPEGHPCGEVAERMIDKSPDITRRIDALEKSGLVERERSTQDRRVVITRITRKGLEIIDQVGPYLQEFEAKISENLSEKDLSELTRICEKFMELNEEKS